MPANPTVEQPAGAAGRPGQAVEELARSVGDDAALVRKVTASYRQSGRGNLTPESAVLLARASQLWSLRRR
jgi:hypothetical protein